MRLPTQPVDATPFNRPIRDSSFSREPIYVFLSRERIVEGLFGDKGLKCQNITLGRGYCGECP